MTEFVLSISRDDRRVAGNVVSYSVCLPGGIEGRNGFDNMRDKQTRPIGSARMRLSL